MALGWSHPSVMDLSGPHCVLVDTLLSAEVKVGLRVSFYFCKVEHGSLSCHVPLFHPHNGTEKKIHTIEPTKTQKLILYYFTVSTFTTLDILSAGKENNTQKVNLKPALHACIISSLHYRGDPLPRIKYTSQETATWWVYYSDSWAVSLECQESVAMWDSYNILNPYLFTSNFTYFLLLFGHLVCRNLFSGLVLTIHFLEQKYIFPDHLPDCQSPENTSIPSITSSHWPLSYCSYGGNRNITFPNLLLGENA